MISKKIPVLGSSGITPNWCHIPLGTDSEAYNFDINSTENDGSCIDIYEGCTDSLAFNFDPNANTDDGSCIPIVLGKFSHGDS